MPSHTASFPIERLKAANFTYWLSGAQPPRAATPGPTKPGVEVEGAPLTTGRTVHRPEGSGAFPATPVVVRVKAQDVILAPQRDGIASILAGGSLMVEMERIDGVSSSAPRARRLLVTPLWLHGNHK